MIRRDIIVTALLTFCLTATLFLILPTKSQSGPVYNPWADINGDGKIDILDVVSTTGIYGTTGNSTKNVNVTNWPKSTAMNVWFRTPLNDTWIASSRYNALGFGQLHILASIACLAGNATVNLYSVLWDPSHTSYVYVLALTLQFGGPNPRYYAVTIPVPGEEFLFYAYTTPSPSNAQISLTFYLTWA